MIKNLIITLGSTSIPEGIRRDAESEALACIRRLDDLLDEIGGDAYLCALGEIGATDAMRSIQGAVREVRNIVGVQSSRTTVPDSAK